MNALDYRLERFQRQGFYALFKITFSGIAQACRDSQGTPLCKRRTKKRVANLPHILSWIE